MRVMDELTESHRRTPSFHHAGSQSPRVGGCVGAFFNMFDWNPSKRFTSTKRITAGFYSHTSFSSSPPPQSRHSLVIMRHLRLFVCAENLYTVVRCFYLCDWSWKHTLAGNDSVRLNLTLFPHRSCEQDFT
jgi:hypothetical protein